MKADTSHDSRDSRCPVQASPSLPEAPLGPQAPGTAGRAPRRRPSFCASALRPSVCRSDLTGRVNEQRPRGWARAPVGLCSQRGPRSCSRRPERWGAQLLLGAPRRAPLAGADTCTLAPTGLAPGSTRLPSQTASGWWQRPGLPVVISAPLPQPPRVSSLASGTGLVSSAHHPSLGAAAQTGGAADGLQPW